MKKETIIASIVFFALGFLAGYIYDAQKNWNTLQRAVSAGASRAQGDMPSESAASEASGMTPQGLPEGHPPIDTAAIVQSLESEAAKNPKDPEPRLKFANFLYDQRQYGKAIEWYHKTLELDPKNVNARTDLGTAYFYSGRPQEALREYRKSLEIDPRHGPTLFNIIVVNLEGIRDLAAAQQTWERLEKLNPGYPGLDAMKQRLDAARMAAGSSHAPQ